jgi:hypothetical protein
MFIMGFLIWLSGFIFLRKSSSSDDEKKMFKFAKIGDILLFFGFLFSFLPFYNYGYSDVAISFVLGTIIILQTHFPLIEDESLYPEEIKNENFN